jgi:hypothetical protein
LDQEEMLIRMKMEAQAGDEIPLREWLAGRIFDGKPVPEQFRNYAAGIMAGRTNRGGAPGRSIWTNFERDFAISFAVQHLQKHGPFLATRGPSQQDEATAANPRALLSSRHFKRLGSAYGRGNSEPDLAPPRGLGIGKKCAHFFRRLWTVPRLIEPPSSYSLSENLHGQQRPARGVAHPELTGSRSSRGHFTRYTAQENQAG